MNSSVMSAKEFDEIMKKQEREIKESEEDLRDKKNQFAYNHKQRMEEIRKAYQNIMNDNSEDEYSDIKKQLDELSSGLSNLLK